MNVKKYERQIRIFSKLFILALLASWWFGIISGWLAIIMFVIYTVLAFIAAKSDPEIQKEAEEFEQKILQARRDAEKEHIRKTLLNSVEFRRK